MRPIELDYRMCMDGICYMEKKDGFITFNYFGKNIAIMTRRACLFHWNGYTSKIKQMTSQCKKISKGFFFFLLCDTTTIRGLIEAKNTNALSAWLRVIWKTRIKTKQQQYRPYFMWIHICAFSRKNLSLSFVQLWVWFCHWYIQYFKCNKYIIRL